MLSQEEFLAWTRQNELSEHARSVAQHVRSSGPARRVGGGRHNVTGRYPSRKMGVTIQFESHRVELPTIYELEHDDASWSISTRRPLSSSITALPTENASECFIPPIFS